MAVFSSLGSDGFCLRGEIVQAPGYPAAESVVNKPKGGSGGGPGKSGDGGKVTSGSADDYGSQR